MENLQSDLSDATTEFDNVDGPSPELLRSGDSDSETEIWACVKLENFIHTNVWPIFGGWGVQGSTFWGIWQALCSGKFVWHEPFRALCDVPVHLKLVWNGTSNV